jgi:hypothetical protein
VTENSPTAITTAIPAGAPNELPAELPTELPAVRFAEAARSLGRAAHAVGLDVPAFRCPPKVPGAARTLRRYPGGTVVAVRLRGRAFEEALADMVEGVLVANRVPEPDATRLRPVLAAAAAGDAAAEGGPGAGAGHEAEIVVPPLASVAVAA